MPVNTRKLVLLEPGISSAYVVFLSLKSKALKKHAFSTRVRAYCCTRTTRCHCFPVTSSQHANCQPWLLGPTQNFIEQIHLIATRQGQCANSLVILVAHLAWERSSAASSEWSNHRESVGSFLTGRLFVHAVVKNLKKTLVLSITNAATLNARPIASEKRSEGYDNILTTFPQFRFFLMVSRLHSQQLHRKDSGGVQRVLQRNLNLRVCVS